MIFINIHIEKISKGGIYEKNSDIHRMNRFVRMDVGILVKNQKNSLIANIMLNECKSLEAKHVELLDEK